MITGSIVDGARRSIQKSSMNVLGSRILITHKWSLTLTLMKLNKMNKEMGNSNLKHQIRQVQLSL